LNADNSSLVLNTSKKIFQLLMAPIGCFQRQVERQTRRIEEARIGCTRGSYERNRNFFPTADLTATGLNGRPVGKIRCQKQRRKMGKQRFLF